MTLAVIIPNYNNAKYLPKCLNSVLSQTLKPNEIIVVDDCSTDNSANVIKEYEKKSNIIKGIFLDKNAGVSHARNTGILAAKSEFITTLDADDFYFSSRKLENEMKILEEHSGRAAVYSKLVYCDEDDNIIRYLDYEKSEYFEGNIYKALLKEQVRKTLMRDYCFPKETAINAGLYDESLCLFEDYDFLIRVAEYLPFYCTFEYGTAYRQKEGGLSHKSEKEVRNAKDFAMDKNLAKLPKSQRFTFKYQRIFVNSLIKIYRRIKRHC